MNKLSKLSKPTSHFKKLINRPSTDHSSMQNKSTNKGKRYALMFIGIVVLFTILGLIIYAISNYLHDNEYIGSKELCKPPPNMKWSRATPYISNLGSSLDSYARLENYLECINTGATPSPSQGLLNGCSLIHKRVTVDGVVPSCPPPTTSQPTSGSSNTATSSCNAIPGRFRWKGEAPTYSETGFSSNRITCTGPSPTPTPGYANFTCQRDGTILPFTPCPTRETFTNYLGELIDWISGRPDINQQSKYSLLPGYFS